MQRLGLILFILCLLYVGKSQNISEANNRGLQTQRPIGQVVGNPCRGRFNTERTVTWTSAKAAKNRKGAPFRFFWGEGRLYTGYEEEDLSVNRAAYSKAREWINTEIMRNGSEILVCSIFPQMYLWIQTVWMAEKDTSRLLTFTGYGCSDGMAQWIEAAFFRWRKLGCAFKSPRGNLRFFFFHRFFTLWLFTFYSHCWPF